MIKTLRLKRGLSLEMLATLTGISTSSLSRKEKDIKKLTIKEIIDISEVLKAKPIDLLPPILKKEFLKKEDEDAFLENYKFLEDDEKQVVNSICLILHKKGSH